MKKRYHIYSFLIPFIFLSVSLLFLGVLNNTNILVSDSFLQYYRLLFHLKDVLSGTANIIYSFNKGLGGAMISTYAYYLSSPLNLLLVFFDNIYWFYIIITLFKISLCGTTMYSFLKYHFKDFLPISSYLFLGIHFQISTNIISSPLHFIFCHGMTISLLLANILRNLLLPGTIIDVIVPVSKLAVTSCTKPKSSSVCYVYNFLVFEIQSLPCHLFTSFYI